MRGQDVYEALIEKGIRELHHANSVTTSCTFLELGGLASRGCVSTRGLQQTPQSSDALDQGFGIWDDIFVDTVDIHQRARQVNWYGPVLFVVNVDILNALPVGSEVFVTKKNPTNWINGEAQEARYFSSLEELHAFLQRGTFGQMVTIRTAGGLLPFPTRSTMVMVDDPAWQRSDRVGSVAYTENRLRTAAAAGNTNLVINRRVCRDGCKCRETYANVKKFDHHFL